MATTDAPARSRPVAIAPAIPTGSSSGDASDMPGAVMPYSCQPCARRKVKCDKVTPPCSACRRGNLECVYQAPAPRARKRKLSDVVERLVRYERVLKEHGLLDAVPKSPAVDAAASQDSVNLYWNNLYWNESETQDTPRLVASQGKSRYIDSSLWRNLGEAGIQRLSEQDEDDEGQASGFASDPLTGAFLGVDTDESLLWHHPPYAAAWLLWQTHRDNVEPLCKILHIPTTRTMVARVSKQPESASKVEECILFAIYHFAVLTMNDDECTTKLRESRDVLLRRYHFATRQALVNASFLRTTDMGVLQALVLFLMSCRHSYDPHTFWILTGVAVRIAQRMGLHRDGAKTGLPPFDVQMRRRLFYQIVPLDGHASQVSGVGVSILPGSWDTEEPVNVNDHQISPDMTEMPEAQKAATDMILCLSRASVGKSLLLASKLGYSDAAINETQKAVEEKYIRYCDIIDPLHFLTIGLARSGISYMRLRARLPKVRDGVATDAERKEMLLLSYKILDTNTAVKAHAGMQKFAWYVRRFFLWGTFDSIIYVLTTLWREVNLLSTAEIDTAWSKIAQVYQNHDELLSSRRALHVAFGRLTLKAWDANPPGDSVPEPAYISSLRSQREAKAQGTAPPPTIDTQSNTVTVEGSSSSSTAVASTDNFDMSLWTSDAFDINAVDWMFWDQLMQSA